MLEIALERRTYLERLADGPAWKRDLIDDLGDSRSTVDRAIAALTDAGLVERTDEGFRLTYSGHVMLEAVTEARAVGETVAAADGTLNHLPTDSPRDHRFFADAELTLMVDTPPATVLRATTDVLDGADRFLGASFVANDERFVDRLYEQTVETGTMEAEFAVTGSLASWVNDRYPSRTQRFVENDHFRGYVVDSLPHAFYLAERDGETTAYIEVHAEQDNVVGFVENDAPWAVSWLRSRWDATVADAVPLGTYLRDVGAWQGT
jgi:DNA-binding transcriptional ArsR family regulator